MADDRHRRDRAHRLLYADNREMDPEQRVIDYVRERGEFIDCPATAP